MDNESGEPQPPDTETGADNDTALEPVLSDDEGPITDIETAARRDGWTPFARRLFLQVLAETGRVSIACEYTGLTRQSAYSLRTRDPVFAASWDAAWDLARAPLADELYERALDGTTETITRDGEVVATRHRHDSRLSMAVLTRLDKRADRAEERGSRHLALVSNWDDWLRLVGKGEERTAMALLESAAPETAQHCQFRQLPLGGNPTNGAEGDTRAGLPGPGRACGTDDEEETEEVDLSARCWAQDEMGEKVWMTDFPPPPGFTGHENRPYDELGDDNSYERECTPEEVALLEAHEAADRAADRTEEDQLRDLFFKALKEAECTEAETPAEEDTETAE